MEKIFGGVTAAKGFTAAGIHVGVKTHNVNKKDLALIMSEKECAAAATYTTNRVKGSALLVTMEHLKDGKAWGIVVNSGNANACAPRGEENARAMARAAAAVTGRRPEDLVISSTGVIGQTLKIGVIEQGLPTLAAALSVDGSDAAAHAIMTTDTVKKESAYQLVLGGKTVKIGAIAKGSGMIHPNMGTMLCFITTDCAISSEMLQKALKTIVPRTFNRVTIDGDTSTNDMCVVLANGMAGNPGIVEENEDYHSFAAALSALCTEMARKIASDGEGAGRLITCTVAGAREEKTAEGLAKSVVSSSLLKAAMFGADANWGRVLCAMGYAGIDFDPARVDIFFASAEGRILVCQSGIGVDFDEELAAKILKQEEIIIYVDLHDGEKDATCWGCDLTYEYVRINGDYRT